MPNRSTVQFKTGILLILFGLIVAPGVWGFGDFPASVPGIFFAGVMLALVGLFLVHRSIKAQRRVYGSTTGTTRKSTNTEPPPIVATAPEPSTVDVLHGRVRFLLICVVEVILTTILVVAYRYEAAQAAFRTLMDLNGKCSASRCFDAAQALSATHNTPLLIDALRAPRWEARHAAAMELKYEGDQNAIQPLIAVLRDPQAQVRSEAASALGVTDSEIQIDPLIAALNDPDSGVVNSAARSLISLAQSASSRRSRAAPGDPRVHKIIVGMRKALKVRNAATNGSIYEYLIEHGEGRSELLESIREFGDLTMATSYLCSGEPALEAAAVQWAGANHYEVVNFSAPCRGARWATSWN